MNIKSLLIVLLLIGSQQTVYPETPKSNDDDLEKSFSTLFGKSSTPNKATLPLEETAKNQEVKTEPDNQCDCTFSKDESVKDRLALEKTLHEASRYILEHPSQVKKFSSEHLDAIRNHASLYAIQDSYIALFIIKNIFNFQSFSLPAMWFVPKLKQSTNRPYNLNEATSDNMLDNESLQEAQQHITLAEIGELIEHNQEDLQERIYVYLSQRHDKKEIVKILLARHKANQIKLKKLGVTKIPNKKSLLSSPLALLTLSTGGLICTSLLLASSLDTKKLKLQIPSTERLKSNSKELLENLKKTYNELTNN